MGTPVDDAKFKEGLIQDLADAEAMSKQSASARGGPVESDFVPRAIRIKNKAVGQKELEDSKLAVDNAIKELVNESGLVDEVEVSKFERGLRQKMNQYRMYMMRQAGEAEKKRAKAGVAAQNEAGALSALSSIARGTTSAIIAGMGQGGGDKTPVPAGPVTGAPVPGQQALDPNI